MSSMLKVFRRKRYASGIKRRGRCIASRRSYKHVNVKLLLLF